MYIYIYTHIYIHIYTYVYTHTHTHTDTYIHICIRHYVGRHFVSVLCIYIYIYICIYTHIHRYMYTYIHTSVCGEVLWICGLEDLQFLLLSLGLAASASLVFFGTYLHMYSGACVFCRFYVCIYTHIFLRLHVNLAIV